MNILVIGNGFDVAHGLPTRYIDFIKFLKYFIYYDSAFLLEKFYSQVTKQNPKLFLMTQKFLLS
ncbi:Bacteriophage abortive infection AbiH, partial [Clostridium sp. DSM 8431]|uniref:AbiH family protein n=1 Tax=Clostridium sp. DSM 8431 TaxID=1761781 RepID=UPI0008E11703